METENKNVEQTNVGEKRKKIYSILLNIVLIFAIIILIVRLSILVFLTNIYVTGPSMYPTLEQGETGYTRKIFNYSSVDRFDIIVINAERFAGKDAHWVKRVIALPGETISYEIDEINKKGVLIINGRIVEEDFIKGYDDLSKDDITYATGNISERKLANDEYFVMGDNRGHSTDSRVEKVGHIKKEEIFGVGIIITGRCSELNTSGTCGTVKNTNIRIEGW